MEPCVFQRDVVAIGVGARRIVCEDKVRPPFVCAQTGLGMIAQDFDLHAHALTAATTADTSSSVMTGEIGSEMIVSCIFSVIGSFNPCHSV